MPVLLQEGRAWDFGLFTTWNAVYEGGKVPWDPDYRDGKLLEAEAYKQNFREIDHIEDAGWDYVWFGGGHFSTQGSMDPSPSCCPPSSPTTPRT